VDDQELKRRISNNHQEHVSMMLNWVGIEEVRAAYLGDYRNVLSELADPPLMTGPWCGLTYSTSPIPITFTRYTTAGLDRKSPPDLRQMPLTTCTI